MSDAWDGLPPPEWRDKDGWHWLGDLGDADADDIWPEPWWASYQRWDLCAPAAAARRLRYLDRCYTPAEIAALRERAEKAEAPPTGVATMLLADCQRQVEKAKRELIREARAEALREAVEIIRSRVQVRIEPHFRAAASKIEAGIAGGMAAMADDVVAAIRDLIMRSVPTDRALIEKEKTDAS